MNPPNPTNPVNPSNPANPLNPSSGFGVVPRSVYVVPLPGGAFLELGARTLVMGVLNVTPDSFADGGRFADPVRAADAALAMEAAGADLIDIGGESTRPGADPVSADEERARIEPVLERLAGRLTVPISIDTYKAVVAEAALDRGAAVVNDISALRYDPDLARVVAHSRAALILMHNRGRSREMYRAAEYRNVPDDVADELGERTTAAEAAGIERERLIVDPGIGFAKRAEHSLAMLAGLPRLLRLDRPVLVGPSRKSFLQAALGDRPADLREWATAAAVTAAVLLGAHIVRVHGVSEMVDVVRTADAIRRAGERNCES
jgi:dihydropteroate synthase